MGISEVDSATLRQAQCELQRDVLYGGETVNSQQRVLPEWIKHVEKEISLRILTTDEVVSLLKKC